MLTFALTAIWAAIDNICSTMRSSDKLENISLLQTKKMFWSHS